MATMTNVALPAPVAATPWTLIFTGASTGTLTVHNRTPDSAILVRVAAAAGTTGDSQDAAAMLVNPFEKLQIPQIAASDLVYARLLNMNPAMAITGRVTVMF